MVVKKTTAEKKEYSGFVVVNFNYKSYLILIWFTIVRKYNWTLIKWMKEVKILGNYLDELDNEGHFQIYGRRQLTIGLLGKA